VEVLVIVLFWSDFMKRSHVLKRALALIRRADRAEAKLHWQEGESLEQVVCEMRNLLSDIRLYREMNVIQQEMRQQQPGS
jgi:hypothetical protein